MAMIVVDTPHDKSSLLNANLLYYSVSHRTSTEMRLMFIWSATILDIHVHCNSRGSELQKMHSEHPPFQVLEGPASWNSIYL